MYPNILLILCCAILASCATLFNSEPQSVNFSGENNETAEVELSLPNQAAYKTQLPHLAYITPSSFDQAIIRVIDPCYNSYQLNVRKNVDSTYWANVFNFHGFYIDYFSGKMWEYQKYTKIPLTEVKGANTDCAKQVRKENVPIMEASYLPLPRLNKFGSGFLVTVNDNDLHGIGVYIEYGRKLTPELMLNLRYQYYNQSRNDYDCERNFYCGYEVGTSQSAISLSVRRYIYPESKIYLGLGAAFLRVKQTSYNYGSRFEDVSSSYNTSSLFAELGWLARVDSLVFNFNVAIDFVDLHFSRPHFKDNGDNTDQITDDSHRALAKDDLLSLGKNTHLSFGLNYPF